MSFVEIHFHLLPGVDDGPSTVDESIALARAAVLDGTRVVVVTPHVHSQMFTDPSEIRERTASLSDRLKLERVPLTLLPGGELDHRLVHDLPGAQLELIAQGPAGRRWLLLEAPFAGLGGDFTAAADDLRARGFAVVVAHPERARPTADTNAVLAHEIGMGSVLQLTAGSVAGLLGRREHDVALQLLHDADRAVIASDAHGLKRMPSLTPAVQALAAAGDSDPSRFAAAIPRTMLECGVDLLPAARVA